MTKSRESRGKGRKSTSSLGQDSTEVFSFSDVDDEESDDGFDFLPGQTKQGEAKQLKQLSLKSTQKRKSLPEYPKTEINFSILDVNGTRDMKESERIKLFIDNLIKQELTVVDKTYSESFVEMVEKVSYCCQLHQKGVGRIIQEFLKSKEGRNFLDERAAKKPKVKRNTKNIMLQKQESKLLETIKDLEGKINEWDQLVSKSKNEIDTMGEDKMEDDTESESLNVELEPCLKEMLQNLKEKLATAPSALELQSIDAKQKLHKIQKNARRSARARTGLVKAFEKEIFSGYTNINNPQKLIKYLIKPKGEAVNVE